MVLYRATKDGNIPLSNDEEAEIRKAWDDEDKKVKIAPNSLEKRITDCEATVTTLEEKLSKLVNKLP